MSLAKDIVDCATTGYLDIARFRAWQDKNHIFHEVNIPLEKSFVLRALYAQLWQNGPMHVQQLANCTGVDRHVINRKLSRYSKQNRGFKRIERGVYDALLW